MSPRNLHSTLPLAHALALLLTISAGVAEAQDIKPMSGMTHGEAAASHARTEFSAAMEEMMQSMESIEPTGKPDVDFLLLMIPHHERAVDMARALLAQSDDEEVAALARAIVDTQQAEIQAMQRMLARLGHLAN